MNITPQQLQKINFFNKLSIEMCGTIANKVSKETCKPDTFLLKEGDTGDTMILIFKGQVVVTKNMMVKAAGGFTTSQKPIIRIETSEPPPDSQPKVKSTVSIVKEPAFGIGEFSLVLDNAIRTANVKATTDIEYGILKLKDFTVIVEQNPSIGGLVYYEVAKTAVDRIAKMTQDNSNLTQAFFYALIK